MSLFLLKDRHLSLRCLAISPGRSAVFGVQAVPVTFDPNGDTPQERDCCKWVRNLLDYSTPRTTTSRDEAPVPVTFPPPPPAKRNWVIGISMMITDKAPRAEVTLEGRIFGDLRNELFVSNMKATVIFTMKNFTVSEPQATGDAGVIFSKEMEIIRITSNFSGCMDTSLSCLPSAVTRDLMKELEVGLLASTKTLTAQFTVEVKIDNLVQVEPANKVCKKILQEVPCDMKITVQGGVGQSVYCHQCVLTASSSKLEAEMESAKKKGGSDLAVEMQMLSEMGTRALLAFLYHRYVILPLNHPSIAVELLEAAHHFEIKSLKKAMTQLLLKMEDSWWTPDATISLFIYCVEAEMGKDVEKLKTRALQILKRDIAVIETSACYIKLFADAPEKAVFLSRALLYNQ